MNEEIVPMVIFAACVTAATLLVQTHDPIDQMRYL